MRLLIYLICTLDLNLEPNSMIEFVRQNQLERTPAMIYMIMPIYIEEEKIVLKEELVARKNLIGKNIKRD